MVPEARRIAMAMILAFIVANMGFLWSGARFRIVGSEISTVNGGDVPPL
jgi:hypothetical protein